MSIHRLFSFRMLVLYEKNTFCDTKYGVEITEKKLIEKPAICFKKMPHIQRHYRVRDEKRRCTKKHPLGNVIVKIENKLINFACSTVPLVKDLISIYSPIKTTFYAYLESIWLPYIQSEVSSKHHFNCLFSVSHSVCAHEI